MTDAASPVGVKLRSRDSAIARPVYLQQRTCLVSAATVVECHERLRAIAARQPLFDHRGASDDRRWHGKDRRCGINSSWFHRCPSCVRACPKRCAVVGSHGRREPGPGTSWLSRAADLETNLVADPGDQWPGAIAACGDTQRAPPREAEKARAQPALPRRAVRACAKRAARRARRLLLRTVPLRRRTP
jgi:hypothetical protein